MCVCVCVYGEYHSDMMDSRVHIRQTMATLLPPSFVLACEKPQNNGHLNIVSSSKGGIATELISADASEHPFEMLLNRVILTHILFVLFIF